MKNYFKIFYFVYKKYIFWPFTYWETHKSLTLLDIVDCASSSSVLLPLGLTESSTLSLVVDVGPNENIPTPFVLVVSTLLGTPNENFPPLIAVANKLPPPIPVDFAPPPPPNNPPPIPAGFAPPPPPNNPPPTPAVVVVAPFAAGGVENNEVFCVPKTKLLLFELELAPKKGTGDALLNVVVADEFETLFVVVDTLPNKFGGDALFVADEFELLSVAVGTPPNKVTGDVLDVVVDTPPNILGGDALFVSDEFVLLFVAVGTAPNKVTGDVLGDTIEAVTPR